MKRSRPRIGQRSGSTTGAVGVLHAVLRDTIIPVWTSLYLRLPFLSVHLSDEIHVPMLTFVSPCPPRPSLCVLLVKTNMTWNNSRGAGVVLRVSGALCGPVLMSHMWPVKKDPSDLAIRLITTQYILMSRVTSYTYNIHIHSTHAGSYMYLDDTAMTALLVIFSSFILHDLFY